jgi:hypothetical protein
MAEYTPAQFARALERAVGKAPKEAVAVVRKGGNNVKRDARRNVTQTAPVHNARAQQFINYDVDVEGVEVVAEVGYDRTMKPARLGNLLEFGGGGDKSPPHPDRATALETEEPRFTQALGDLGEGLIPG